MIGGRSVLLRALDDTFPKTAPAAVSFQAAPFDETVVSAVKRDPEVGTAQGRRVISTSYHSKSRGSEENQNIVLYVVKDYDSISVNKLGEPDIKRWPRRGEMLLETGSVAFSGLAPGDVIRLEAVVGDQAELVVAGTVHDLNAALPIMNGQCVGFVSWDSLPDLGEPQSYNELNVVSARPLSSISDAGAFGSHLRDEVLEPAGVTILRMAPSEPGVQPIADIFSAVSLLLVLVGVLTLALSGFLVINTISALVVQQTAQLGIMRTVGAKRGQLASMYLAMVVTYGALALLLAMPAGQLGTRRFVEFGSGILNYRVADFSTPPLIVALEFAVGLFVPLFAAAAPVISGMRMPVREALYGSQSLGGEFGEDWLDRLLSRIRGLPRPIALSLRSSFKRKGRLALTLMTLLMASAVFISVSSVRSSIFETVETIGHHRTMDVWAHVYPGQPLERMERLALKVPDVSGVEGWVTQASVRVRPDRSESPPLRVNGVPPDSRYFHPEITAGRWLMPGDTNAIVIDQGFLDNDPDVGIGALITLRLGEQEEAFRVVGLMRGDLLESDAWVNRDELDKLLGNGGRVDTLMIGTSPHDAQTQADAAREIADSFAEEGVRVTSTITQHLLKNTIHDSLNIIVLFLAIMAGLLVLVGGIGLSGTMSINVLESTREIGVMRALGASNAFVYSIFITEGVVVGLISWVLGVIAGAPLSLWLTRAIENAIGLELSFVFSSEGAIAWLAFTVVISVLASLLPAARAARVSVAEAIAYE